MFLQIPLLLQIKKPNTHKKKEKITRKNNEEGLRRETRKNIKNFYFYF